MSKRQPYSRVFELEAIRLMRMGEKSGSVGQDLGREALEEAGS